MIALGRALCLLLLLAGEFAWADVDPRHSLRDRMEMLESKEVAVVAGQPLQSMELLRALYEQRAWRPIWFDAQGRPTALRAQLLAAVDRAHAHGLQAQHYHRDPLGQLLAERDATDNAVRRLDLELLASDGLLSLGAHLLHGRLDPESIDSGWLLQRDVPDLLQLLSDPPADQPVDLVAVLDGLAPRYPGYWLLLERLALQRELAHNGDWAVIDDGPLLRPGTQDARVPAIRQRLLRLGDFLPEEGVVGEDPALYTKRLEQGVRAFQRRHGLAVDGIIGPRTLAELNVTPAQREAQLRANLERWRWLPRDLGEEYLLVNIAGYTMQLRADDEIVMTQRVVVGTPARRTPVFSGRMSYLVLNPSWEVPPRLVVQDLLPRIRADESYLERMGFSVYQGWGADERRIDPDSVDWARLSARNFPYRLRQAPGPENALGRVKFMFPNRHHVYLHDTPARGLFQLEERAFSSGCIRIEDADTLTQWLLNERSAIMPPERIRAVLDSGVETTVRLDRPLPVHLLYWTAWVDDQGRIQYRRDVYRRDPPLIEALDAAPVHPRGTPSFEALDTTDRRAASAVVVRPGAGCAL